MITPSTIYWLNVLSKLPSIMDAFVDFLIGLFIANFISMLVRLDVSSSKKEEEEIGKLHFKIGKINAIVLIFVLLLSPFLPNRKELIAIYLIPKIANNQKLDNITQSGLGLIQKEIDDYLKDKK